MPLNILKQEDFSIITGLLGILVSTKPRYS